MKKDEKTRKIKKSNYVCKNQRVGLKSPGKLNEKMDEQWGNNGATRAQYYRPSRLLFHSKISIPTHLSKRSSFPSDNNKWKNIRTRRISRNRLNEYRNTNNMRTKR